jgi:hypothetical protein
MLKTRRITLPITDSIDLIVDKVQEDTGIRMTYTQIINFLIHFYIKHANEPRTQWRSIK